MTGGQNSHRRNNHSGTNTAHVAHVRDLKIDRARRTAASFRKLLESRHSQDWEELTGGVGWAASGQFPFAVRMRLLVSLQVVHPIIQ